MLTLAAISIALSGSCGPRETLLRNLATKYSERIIQIDVAPTGKHSQALFYNRNTGTWTIAVFDTNAIACILKSGRVKPIKEESL